jgi:YegS/Rv2252/BmrU family lipid kinase
MRAAVIVGLGCSAKDLKPFQIDQTIEWRMGMPAPDDHVDVILLFGGDGTIHRHLGQLVKLQVPVLIVPAGSGNDFASSLRLKRVRDSLTAWKQFCDKPTNLRALDLGLIRSDGSSEPAVHHYFCCVAGVGLDSEVARRANSLPRWLRGHGGYALSMLPTIFSFSPLPIKLLTPQDGNADKPEWTIHSNQPTLVAAFANAPLYGGGMKVAPRARMDDGLLDVCIVAAVSPLRLLWLFPSVYAGRHLGIREVEYFQADRVRVETEEPQDVYADGEFVCRTPVEVSVERRALNVVTLS